MFDKCFLYLLFNFCKKIIYFARNMIHNKTIGKTFAQRHSLYSVFYTICVFNITSLIYIRS